jgi:hypothetical protein
MKSIRARLTAGLALIIVFFLVQAALVWLGQDNARREVVDATRKNTLASAQLSELAVLAQQVRRYEKEYFVYVGNRERRDNYVMGLMLTLPKAVSAPLAELTAADEISKGKVDKKVQVADIAEFDGLSQALERLRLGQQALLARIRR